MPYFENFPSIKFFDTTIKNISPKTSFTRNIFKSNMLANYTMKENETAESLAQDFYGDPELDWVIHLANKIVDPILDYPLKNRELEDYTASKYDTEIYFTHHWEKDGLWYDEDPTDGTAVSYIEYESFLNDKKRNIKILRPEFLSIVLSQFDDLIGEAEDITINKNWL